MQQQGVVADAITYNALIRVSETGKKPEQAPEVFAAMKQQGVVPNAMAYNSLISACEKGKQPEQALEVFTAME